MWRMVALVVGLLAAVPAVAGEMNAKEARRFVVGKVFNYTCFEGTRGAGRVLSNGGVVGSIQFQGVGRVYYAALPAGTLREEGQSVCASLRGLPFQPCFDLERTGKESFRGSIAGLGFLYCEFTRRHGRAHVTRRHRQHRSPLKLRPSLTADNK